MNKRKRRIWYRQRENTINSMARKFKITVWCVIIVAIGLFVANSAMGDISNRVCSTATAQQYQQMDCNQQ